MTDSAHAEYTELVKLRDRAAYGVAGAAIVSVAYLNLGETSQSSHCLTGSRTHLPVSGRSRRKVSQK